MDKKQNIIPLQELNLTSRFLFDEVLEDPQVHQDVLGIIFQRDIPLLKKNETEKELRVSPLLRSIRMDVFSMDEEKSVYNTEMQQKRRADLAKRSRYYQSLVDAGLLEPGVPDYNRLNTSYIIMIMPFDLFGYKKYVYTFRPRCEEAPECLLEDGATRIFLNTRGENDDEVPRELAEFLHYLEETTDERAASTDSQRIKRIHSRVRKVRLSEEVGVKYMQAWEEKYYEREEGREEGRKEGKVEGREEGRKEGKVEGARNKLRELAIKKYHKGMSVEEIADWTEEKPELIRELLREELGPIKE